MYENSCILMDFMLGLTKLIYSPLIFKKSCDDAIFLLELKSFACIIHWGIFALHLLITRYKYLYLCTNNNIKYGFMVVLSYHLTSRYYAVACNWEGWIEIRKKKEIMTDTREDHN